MSKNFTQSTPARFLPSRAIGANRRAMVECIDTIPAGERIETIADIRYGTGSWAYYALRRFPEARLYGWEIDALTASSAFLDSRVTLTVGSWTEGPKVSPVDLLLADFNMTTVNDRKDLDEAVIEFDPKWVTFTDVAANKLHMNWKAYGLEGPGLEAYWKGFHVEGYDFVAFSRQQHAASTGLYKRKTPRSSRGLRS